MQAYIAREYADLLAHNQLNSFADFWAKHIDWFEAPNQRRGGWSGVGKLTLADAEGRTQTFYLKKQQNHGRRTWRHPLKGEPTFRREFENLQLLAAHRFAAPNVAFYAEANENGAPCAVLMTAELTNFKDMAELTNTWLPTASRMQKMQLIKKIANEIKHFHGLGFVHRALYPKHIFVKNVDTLPEVALIDCEKMRKGGSLNSRTIFDLSALNRHSQGWRNAQRMVFFKYYCGIDKLDANAKQLARHIIKRATRT